MRISDWSSDVCSSDLTIAAFTVVPGTDVAGATGAGTLTSRACAAEAAIKATGIAVEISSDFWKFLSMFLPFPRSEEHTSELQSLMRSSYAVFCLNKKQSLTTNIHPSPCTIQ